MIGGNGAWDRGGGLRGQQRALQALPPRSRCPPTPGAPSSGSSAPALASPAPSLTIVLLSASVTRQPLHHLPPPPRLSANPEEMVDALHELAETSPKQARPPIRGIDEPLPRAHLTAAPLSLTTPSLVHCHLQPHCALPVAPTISSQPLATGRPLTMRGTAELVQPPSFPPCLDWPSLAALCPLTDREAEKVERKTNANKRVLLIFICFC